MLIESYSRSVGEAVTEAPEEAVKTDVTEGFSAWKPVEDTYWNDGCGLSLPPTGDAPGPPDSSISGITLAAVKELLAADGPVLGSSLIELHLWCWGGSEGGVPDPDHMLVLYSSGLSPLYDDGVWTCCWEWWWGWCWCWPPVLCLLISNSSTGPFNSNWSSVKEGIYIKLPSVIFLYCHAFSQKKLYTKKNLFFFEFAHFWAKSSFFASDCVSSKTFNSKIVLFSTKCL